MIRFDLLCDLKEVESMEHHTQSSNIINKTVIRQVIHSDNMSPCLIIIMDLLGYSLSHAMGKGATKNPNSLS